MAEQFRDQGGAATMDPGPLTRWLTSAIMTRLSAPVDKRRAAAEKQRIKRRAPHRVAYFHQVDDGYSHLAAQVLQRPNTAPSFLSTRRLLIQHWCSWRRKFWPQVKRAILSPGQPMVMRGVPATREKGFYNFMDAAREAGAAGVSYGNFYDPIGEPARRCYCLYPRAVEQGRGVELVSSFLNHAFSQGVNTNNDRGLRKAVEAAGLDWNDAQHHLCEAGWEDILEENRLAMCMGILTFQSRGALLILPGVLLG